MGTGYAVAVVRRGCGFFGEEKGGEGEGTDGERLDFLCWIFILLD